MKIRIREVEIECDCGYDFIKKRDNSMIDTKAKVKGYTMIVVCANCLKQIGIEIRKIKD
jgi:hypothetical protein